MKRVAVSAVMPVWNRDRYLAEAIESVLGQTFGELELILVDDGSTDRSPQILADYARRDERVVVIQQPNAGCYAARNTALNATRGEFTAILDSDDTATPDRLEKQVAFLTEHADHAAVGSWVTFTDPYGVPNQTSELPTRHDAIDAALLHRPGAMVHGATTCRTALLRELGGYRAVRCSADYDLLLRLGERGRLCNLPEVLTHVRTHLGSITANGRRRQIDLAHQFRREAHERRGLPLPPDLTAIPGTGAEAEEPTSRAVLTIAEQTRSWALHAIRTGNLRIARRHAWHTLRHAPLRPESWRLMRWAITG